MDLNRFLFQMVAVFAGLSSSVLGQGVVGTLPTDFTISTAAVVPPSDVDWIGRVGKPRNPILVSLDPFGPAWTKNFATDTGDPILTMQNIDIGERLQIAGDYAWTGWCCTILRDDFTWSTTGYPSTFSLLANGVSVPGLEVVLTGTTLTASFDSLPVGTNVEVYMKIAYIGSPPFSGSFQVKQYPVPEPTTLLGLLMLMCFVRKR